MIYIELSGRCGNQLYEYAFARAMMEKTGDQTLIVNDFMVRKNARMKPNERGFVNELAYFHTIPWIPDSKNGRMIFQHTNLIQKIIMLPFVILFYLLAARYTQLYNKIQCFFQPVMNRMGIYWMYGVNKLSFYKHKKRLIFGTCESPIHFDHIRHNLLEELTPIADVMESNKQLFNRIQQEESVCISVRRGDYFIQDAMSTLAICNERYFREAVSIIHKEIPYVTFFLFSDDVEWCKTHVTFGTEINITYVNQNMPVYETLRLMYNCKHFIISNSSFSWWGQYLSRNDQKIVIAPSRWDKRYAHHHMIDPSWTLIDVNKL